MSAYHIAIYNLQIEQIYIYTYAKDQNKVLVLHVRDKGTDEAAKEVLKVSKK